MSEDTGPHRFETRVYYEDTDLAGIVYYANYLKYIERARTEWVRGLGIDQVKLKADTGIVFAVSRLEANYTQPGRFDDILSVTTLPLMATPARLTLAQAVYRQQTLLFDAEVTLVAIGPDGRPTRLPEEIRAKLGA